MRRESDWRARNNPLHLDLFERSSQSLSSSASSSTLDIAQNDEGNVRRCLSDYARPVLQRPVTRIHAHLAINVNFRIDSHMMIMLPIFHGKPSEDPYRHVDELSQVYEINQTHNMSTDVMKMKSHADPRGRLRGAEVTRVCVIYIYILYMVIVSISIPFIETR